MSIVLDKLRPKTFEPPPEGPLAPVEIEIETVRYVFLHTDLTLFRVILYVW